ncbi:SoxY-related AACIE arm protein [Rhizobacter fulvus]
MSDRGGWTRRALLGAAVGVVGSIAWRSAAASPEELAAAIRAFAGGAPLRTGRVLLDIAPLVENGNVVPISVKVDSPMTEADHVTAIAVFNERNPQRDVAVFHLGPRAGRAAVATRIRLATSQQLVAVARMNDGSCFMHTVDVIVTLAACVES